MDHTTYDTTGKRPNDISTIRARGFAAINQHLAAVQIIAAGLAEIDDRIGFATEMTVDDRNALLESARRLQLLLDGGAAR